MNNLRNNLRSLLLTVDPVSTLKVMHEKNKLREFEPTLADLDMKIPNGYHHKNVLDHSFKVLDKAMNFETNEPDLILRTAALFHDIGKPATRKFEDKGKVTFVAHEIVGARMMKKILKRHYYSFDEMNKIIVLVKMHMRSHSFKTGWTDSAVRRLLTEAGNREQLDRLIILFKSDITTKHSHKEKVIIDNVVKLEKALNEIEHKNILAKRRPALNGHEVMTLFGLKEGKELGDIMRFLNREENIKLSREQAIKKVKENYGNFN